MAQARILAIALVALTLHASLARAQATAAGRVTGCIDDTSTGVLPGVTVMALTPERRYTTTADSEGCYVLPLPAGVYMIVAHLPGFDAGMHADVHVEPGAVQQVDFRLRLGPICECLRAPRSLREMWQRSTAVVHVRIDKAVPPFGAMRLSAIVLEVLKRDKDGGPAGDRITVLVRHLLDQHDGLINQYLPGNEFLLFFDGGKDEFGAVIYDDRPWAVPVDRAGTVQLPFNGAGQTRVESVLNQLRVFAAKR